MQVQVKQWGNSQGIILTKEMLHSSGIALGDILNVTVKEGMLSLEKPFRHKTLEERIQDSGIPLTLSDELDYGEPRGGELW